MIRCGSCENGEVWVECCNGAGGCLCKGRQVFFATCAVCNGTGIVPQGADSEANIRAIRRAAAATGGYFGNPHGRLR